MLVLSRKAGQAIVIDGEIVVSVVDIGRGRVQIGVTAPLHLSIHREEIFKRIRQENGSAVKSSPPIVPRLECSLSLPVEECV